MTIVKSKPSGDPRETYIVAMWLLFLRAPGRETLTGEPVALGEIGRRVERRV